MRQYPTDYRLWAIITGVLFVPMVILWLVSENLHHGRIDRIVMDVVILVGFCATMGWAFQAIAVVFGVRLQFRPDTQPESGLRRPAAFGTRC